MDFRAGHLRTRCERRKKDRDPSHWVQADRRQSDLLVIHWKSPDGTESSGHPLPRAHAEALLRAFVGQCPLSTFWLEVPPALDDMLRYR
jgi:hypothetical protein